MGQPAVIPPPPPGFIPIEQAQGSIPPPPPGFVPIDSPEAMRAASVARNAQPTEFEKNAPDTLLKQYGENYKAMGRGIETGANAIVNFPGQALDALGKATGAIDPSPEDIAYRNKSAVDKVKQVVSGLNPLPPETGQGMTNRVIEGAANLGTQAAFGDAIKGVAPDVAMSVKEVVKLPPKVIEGVLAKRMAEKVDPRSPFTRQEVMDAARANGVNLDLAQATDSPIVNSVKKATEYTLGGGGEFESNTAKNVQALEKWANSQADSYAPGGADRSSVGTMVQSALKEHLAGRKNVASEAFKELDKTVGQNNVDVTQSVQQEAQKIVDANKGYYEAHPELKPKQAWSVLEDLANRPVEKAATPPSGLVDEAGKAYPGKPQVISSTKAMSWTELHQLRSDLMDFYRNNPDIVKGRSDAWIQQMVGKIDDAMTGAASGLKGPDLAKFRQANQVWESIKTTYDNPRSPYYQAVRSMRPENIPANLAASPEFAKQVRSTLASLEDGKSLEGSFQRQFVENIINSKDGALDLKNLNSKLSRIPDDILQSMVGAKGAKQLRLLAKVAQKVTADSNPSGTAKSVIRTGEIVNAFHNPIGAAAEIATTKAVGKGMTSPKVVDFLTRPRGNPR